MDQIFDRFERLFKSWVAGDAENLFSGTRPGGHRGSGDPDLDSAMDELDDFLARDRTETEAQERIKSRRAAEEEARRADSRRQSTQGSTRGPSGPHPRLVQAYRTLGLAYGKPFPEVKIAYKRLLMQNHPDRNSATSEQLKRSTEISAQINAAYQCIETWNDTGKVVED